MGVRMEYLIIDRFNDEFCCDEKQFEHLLCSNSRVDIKGGKLLFKKESFDYSMKKWDIDKTPDETVFHLIVSHESDDSEVVEKLGEFDSFIRRMNKQFGSQFVINTVWDDVSSYYEERLYPQMAQVEKLLRDIIYRFMIKAVGSNWYDTATPPAVKDAIDNTLQKNEATSTAEENQLSFADFKHLGMFLFTSYPLQPMGQRAIDKIRKALNEGRRDIEDLLSTYENRSNWDRYFADRIPVEGLKEKWEKLYGYRNQVAHVKHMSRSEFEDASRLVQEIIGVFEECLTHVEDVEMSQEELSAVKEVAKETVGPRNDMSYYLLRLNNLYNVNESYHKRLSELAESIARSQQHQADMTSLIDSGKLDRFSKWESYANLLEAYKTYLARSIVSANADGQDSLDFNSIDAELPD